jgi:hypothetical protein
VTWVVGLWLAVGPVYQGQSTTAATTPGVAGESTHYTSTLIEVNGLRVLPLLLIPVALTALALVAVLVSESRQGTRKVALWGLAVLLLGFCVVGIFSIGLFYVPAAIALVVSAVKSLRQGRPIVQAES